MTVTLDNVWFYPLLPSTSSKKLPRSHFTACTTRAPLDHCSPLFYVFLYFFSNVMHPHSDLFCFTANYSVCPAFFQVTTVERRSCGSGSTWRCPGLLSHHLLGPHTENNKNVEKCSTFSILKKVKNENDVSWIPPFIQIHSKSHWDLINQKKC